MTNDTSPDPLKYSDSDVFCCLIKNALRNLVFWSRRHYPRKSRKNQVSWPAK